jgi:hypothetical protein
MEPNEVTTAKAEWTEWAKEWMPDVRQVESGMWDAHLPFRRVYAQGSSKEEALAGLVRVYCQLARDGSFNPHFPQRVGAPPIQHAIEILNEILKFHVTSRYDDWRDLASECDHPADDRGAAKPGEETTAGGRYTRDPRFNRRNEVISGLATAIAALARVKEL